MHIMYKTPAKLQKDLNKLIMGVAFVITVLEISNCPLPPPPPHGLNLLGAS